MTLCFAADCDHYSQKQRCSFYRFPVDPRLRKKWIRNIGREGAVPGPASRICSCHFVGGDKQNLPTKFNRSVKKRLTFSSPEKRNRRMLYRSRIEEAGFKNVQADAEKDLIISSSETSGAALLSPQLGFDEKTDLASTSGQELAAQTGVAESLLQERRDEQVVAAPSSGCTPVVDELRRQVEILKLENERLTTECRHEVELLKFENEELSNDYQKLINNSFRWQNMKNNQESVIFHTGLPSAEIFETVLSIFEDVDTNYYYGWNVQKINKADQLLMTLMKLRQNTPRYDLGLIFHCSVATVSNVVTTWIYLLHQILFKQLMKEIPSRDKNQTCLPASFSDYSSTRIIIDCTEIYAAVPRSIEAQRLTYSAYKHRNTFKALVGVAPNGVITFVSKLFPGSTSDKEIVRDSGLLGQLRAGDLVMADKGFLIKDLLPEGVSFNIPPFLSSPQFTPSEVAATKSIARARIHVERANRRIKTFKILQMIPASMREHASVIFQTCAALTNLQYPLIKEVEYLYHSVE